MKQLTTEFGNITIENAKSAYLSWINPHIDLSYQLGYAGLAEEGKISVTDQQVTAQIIGMDNIADDQHPDLQYNVFLLCGKEVINFVRGITSSSRAASDNFAKFLILFLTPTPAPPPTPSQTYDDILFIKQQVNLKNIQVWQGGYDDFITQYDIIENYKNKYIKDLSFVLPSAGLKDTAFLVMAGPKLSGLGFLKYSGFDLETTINSLFSIKFLQILKLGTVPKDLPILDNRYSATTDYTFFRDGLLDYSEASDRMGKEVFQLLNDRILSQNIAFSDIIISRNDNVYSILFGLDKEQLLLNESIYYNLLKNRGLLNGYGLIQKEIVRRSKVTEVRVGRSRVKMVDGYNRLGVPYKETLPFDETWEDVEEMVALGGDDGTGFSARIGKISSPQISDNSNDAIQYYLSTDSELQNKSDGYYQYVTKVQMTDGAREYLRDLLFQYRTARRWFTEYASLLPSTNMFKSDGFLNAKSILQLNTVYAAAPPWRLIMVALQDLISGFFGISEQITNLLQSLASWIRPESVSDSSLGNFISLVDTLEFQIIQFLKLSNVNYSISTEKRFVNHIADATFDRALINRYNVFDPKIPEGMLEIPAGRFAQYFPNRTETSSGTVVFPNEVKIGDSKTNYLDRTPEGKAQRETVLMGIVHAKVMGGLNSAQQGAGGVLIPPTGKDMGLTTAATMDMANRILGTVGISMMPKKKDAGVQASFDTTNILVGDAAKVRHQGGGGGGGDVSSPTKDLGVKLVGGIMQQGITGVKFNKEDGFRDKITGLAPNIPNVPKPGEFTPYDPMADLDYTKFLGVQYLVGYGLDNNNTVDIRVRNWKYVREAELPGLAAAAGKALLCRTYNAKQQSKDNGLEIPTENDYFLIIP